MGAGYGALLNPVPGRGRDFGFLKRGLGQGKKPFIPITPVLESFSG